MPLPGPTHIPPIGEQTDPDKVRVAAVIGGQLASAPARGFGLTPGELTALQDLAAGTSLAAVFGAVRVQAFTSSGTYTPHANMLACIIECSGGGGAGGGVLGTAGQQTTASGGGGGAYSRSIRTRAQVGASQSVTVGAAGLTGGATAGGAGGTSSVGTLCTAPGGSGGAIGQAGVAISAGGTGGAIGTGDFAIAGGDGGGGQGAASIFIFCGWGGSSFYAGERTLILASNGVAGKAYGGGGSAGQSLGATSYSGGNGAIGIVFITEFCSA